eukprot:CAMPEP_0184331306 /NCGR_PEP_ID=MMETSP1089-20130417/633_1 /TAXON_ID=38269 ORGANISM="Gloeochaete wittrockiana, Strain SAG46.84" /NCGR_SAMPLE_ID=MMETSP1089 /ASSEMBLY_ACC=CAM_ASM_000445 /LENGTH=436 /DNA_ID=CAMNT_0026654137 /DNA_START=43 /DNA_END=1353 /DNA_ORIENTATION=+
MILGTKHLGVVRNGLRSYMSTLAGKKTELPNSPIGKFIEPFIQQNLHRDAVSFPHQEYRWTHNEFLKHTNALAAGLSAIRNPVGKRLLLTTQNDVESAVSFLGAARAGLQVVPFSNKSTTDQIFPALRDFKIRTFLLPERIGSREFLKEAIASVPTLDLRTTFSEPIRCLDLPELRSLIHTGEEFDQYAPMLQEILIYDPLPSPIPKIEKGLTGNTTYALNYASSSDSSKFIKWSHNSVLAGAVSTADTLGLSKEERVLFADDFSTLSGFSFFLGALSKTSFFVIPSVWSDPVLTVEHTAKEKASTLFTNPDALQATLGLPNPAGFDTSNLQRVVIRQSPGATVSASTLEKAKTYFPSHVRFFSAFYVPEALSPVFFGEITNVNTLGSPASNIQVTSSSGSVTAQGPQFGQSDLNASGKFVIPNVKPGSNGEFVLA